MKKTTVKNTAFLSAAILGISLVSNATQAADAKMEKCYGIVKAGKNDCASSKKGGHSCAGEAKVSGDKGEWVLVPEGVCERLVNGSLKSS